MGFSTIGGAGGGSAETPSGGAGSTEHAGVDDQSSSNDDQLTIKDGEIVVNEDGDDLDFRVEGDTNTHLIFADGGTERVGVRTAAPVKGLHVVDGALVKGRATFVLSGSIDVTGANVNVPGTNTKYLSELSVGDDITVTGETRTIKTITNDTTATVSEAWGSDLANDTSPECTPAAFSVQRSDGTAAITVEGNRGTALDVTGDTPFVAIRNTAETEAGIFICDDGAPIAQFARILVDSGNAHSGLTGGFSIMTGGETLTGAVNVTASTAVVGVGTAFLTELKVGDRLIIRENSTSDGDSETRAITAITDNTNLTVSPAFSDLGNDTTPAYEARAMQIDRDGTIGMGVRPDTAGEKVALNGAMAFKEQSAAPSATADYAKLAALEYGNDTYTKLLCHMDGSNDGTSFSDVSAGANGGASNHTVTATGAVTKTATNKFGTASAYFAGDDDYLEIPADADFNVGTGNWTFECWVNTSGNGELFSMGHSYFRIFLESGKLKFVGGDQDSFLGNSTTFNDGAWHHVVVVRQGTNITGYKDGVALPNYMTTSSSMGTGSNVVRIGIRGDELTNDLTGYIDEVRFDVGVARYPPYSWWGNSTSGAIATGFDPQGAAWPVSDIFAVDSGGNSRRLSQFWEEVVG